MHLCILHLYVFIYIHICIYHDYIFTYVCIKVRTSEEQQVSMIPGAVTQAVFEAEILGGLRGGPGVGEGICIYIYIYIHVYFISNIICIYIYIYTYVVFILGNRYILLPIQHIKQVMIGHTFGHQSGQHEGSEQNATIC